MADIVYPGDEPQGLLNSAAMPKNHDLVIYKGDYVELFVTVKDSGGTPMDLTGMTPAASIKDTYTDATPVLFTCNLTGQPGEVRIYLSSEASSGLTVGGAIWDFQLTNGTGQTRTYLAGDVTVYNEVTT